MPQIDLDTAIGRLLTDPELRKSFRRNSAITAEQIELNQSDRLAFMALNTEQIEAKAQTLIRKRFHEIKQLLPYTLERMGKEGRVHFLEYAFANWPTGHRRHFYDALEFCKYLINYRIPVNTAEYYRIRFLATRRRFAVYFVKDMFVRGRFRRGFQILFCKSGQPREYALCIEFPRRKT